MFNKKPQHIVSIAYEKKGAFVCSKKLSSWDSFQCKFLEGNESGLPEQLNDYIEENKLSKSLCNISLAAQDYLLIQTEKPDVEENEVNEAIKWKIGDLVPWDVLEISVEHFQTPQGTYARGENIIAVVCKNETIEKIVKTCKKANLKLNHIGIAELYLAQLFSPNQDTNKGTAVIQLSENRGILCLYHNNALYLTRKLEIGEEIFSGDKPDVTEQGAYERIALDLQRSLDYFESTFNLGAIKQVAIFPNNKKSQYLKKYIKESLFMDMLSLGNIELEWAKKIDELKVPVRPSLLNSVAALEEDQ